MFSFHLHRWVCRGRLTGDHGPIRVICILESFGKHRRASSERGVPTTSNMHWVTYYIGDPPFLQIIDTNDQQPRLSNRLGTPDFVWPRVVSVLSGHRIFLHRRPSDGSCLALSAVRDVEIPSMLVLCPFVICRRSSCTAYAWLTRWYSLCPGFSQHRSSNRTCAFTL